jgi:hypothetical protein
MIRMWRYSRGAAKKLQFLVVLVQVNSLDRRAMVDQLQRPLCSCEPVQDRGVSWRGGAAKPQSTRAGQGIGCSLTPGTEQPCGVWRANCGRVFSRAWRTIGWSGGLELGEEPLPRWDRSMRL